MDIVTIREMRQQAGPLAGDFRIHAQLESVSRKTTKTNKPYYELKFVDAEESLLLRAWDNSAAFGACASIQAKGFFAIDGQFFQNAERGGVDAKDFTIRELKPDEIGALLAGSGEARQRQDGDYADIVRLVGQIADPRLRALGRAFLDQFGERMRRTGAARRNHHARRGGLVEHVAQMMRSAVQICVAYPVLNRDLVVSGVLFHDVGKLWENAYAAKGFTMPYTEGSELISHIPVGMELVNRLWREVMDSPEADTWREIDPPSERVRLHLLHLVASHHGELQFGSPVVPKTPEAYALHYIDNLDAKLQMVFEAYEKAPELGKNVFEKQWPLPGNLVRPLEHYTGEVPAVAEAVEAVAVPAVIAESFVDLGSDSQAEPEVNPGDLLPIPEPDFGDEPLPDFEAEEEEEEEPF
jgi:3'-5' exoribonuclease